MHFWNRLFGVLTESQQVGQAGKSASMLEEVMLQQLVRGSSATNVDAETDRQESLQLLAELLGLLQTGCAICCDEVKCLQRLLI